MTNETKQLGEVPFGIAEKFVQQPNLSPDGNSIAYVEGGSGSGRSLMVSDLAGRNPKQILDVPSSFPKGGRDRECGSF